MSTPVLLPLGAGCEYPIRPGKYNPAAYLAGIMSSRCEDARSNILYPARGAVGVAALAGGARALVEVEGIAGL
jgi:hypothetical protein